jgi:hypothetical protein
MSRFLSSFFSCILPWIVLAHTLVLFFLADKQLVLYQHERLSCRHDWLEIGLRQPAVMGSLGLQLISLPWGNTIIVSGITTSRIAGVNLLAWPLVLKQITLPPGPYSL